MKDLAIVEKARINLLTGARSRMGMFGNSSTTSSTPKSDPFEFKKLLMRGHGNITGGLGGEAKASSYQAAFKDLSRVKTKYIGRSASQIEYMYSNPYGTIVPDPQQMREAQEREMRNTIVNKLPPSINNLSKKKGRNAFLEAKGASMSVYSVK